MGAYNDAVNAYIACPKSALADLSQKTQLIQLNNSIVDELMSKETSRLAEYGLVGSLSTRLPLRRQVLERRVQRVEV